MFISHFKKILSFPLEPLESTLTHIDTFGHISKEDVVELMKTISIEAIEYAIKMASPNKALGPDDFNAHFFKVYWPIVGKYVSDAVQDFFHSNKMLKYIVKSHLHCSCSKGRVCY